MTKRDTKNRSAPSAEEPFDRSVDGVLDELLEALRSDQGGPRTEALKRALEQESGAERVDLQRIADLEATVEQLSDDAETGSDGDGTALDEVRSELDSIVDELATLRTTVESIESANESLESRTDDLEAAVTELADRLGNLEEPADSGRSDGSTAPDLGDVIESEDLSEVSTDPAEDDVARWIKHVEKNLDKRTTALASRLREIEQLEERIDDLEERIDERTATLDGRIDDVNATMEEAITLLQEGMESELSGVRSDLDELDELRSSIESIEDDVDALETHAADMTLWRNSIESDDPSDGRGDESE